MFKKAVKSQAKLRLSIAGPSGSGKTYTALAIASNLGNKIAVIDTENASASKYADEFTFDVLEMEAPFHPDRFVEAINEAAQAGYEVVIVDSLSPAWNGSGGLLEIVDNIAKRMKTSNSFAAWKDATPIQNKLAEAIVRSKIHLICTMRAKTEYVLENVNGKNIPKKVGMAPVQREGFEYEFDVVGELNHEHDLIISKTRCRALDGGVYNKAGKEVADILNSWLNDGATPAPEARQLPAPAQTAPAKNGNGNAPTSPAALLALLKSRGCEFNAPAHLLNAIKQEQADFVWPKPEDTDGWRNAYKLAKQHAENKRAAEVQPEPQAPADEFGSLFGEVPAPGAYAYAD